MTRLVTPLTRALIRHDTRATVPATIVQEVHAPGAADEGGVPVATYTDGATEQWLYRRLRAREVVEGSETPLAEAEAWPMRHSVVRGVDRVRLTHLYDEALAAPITYEIVGGPVPDHITEHVYLRSVP